MQPCFRLHAVRGRAAQWLCSSTADIIFGLTMCSKSSCLGEPWCVDWGCCDTDPRSPPAAKRTRVDEERPEKGSRFTAPHSPTTMRKICQGYVPSNTSKSTSWAVRVFLSWREQRNKRVSEQCPEKLLEEPTVEHLNYWLSRFVSKLVTKTESPTHLLLSIFLHRISL